jgi:predicted metal-dependent HD superfamily phosphohydrolase
MYEVKGLKDVYTDDPAKLTPNHAFKIRFGHVRYDDLEEYILNRLENELSKTLYYHNVKHTMDVCIGVEIIGTSEGVTDEELLYLKTAALFHDMGQIIQSKGHEEISCNYAREILPQHNYTETQIDLICEIIMATQLPPNPKTKLQRIICDADLDYLGRTDFIPVSDTLYKELSEQNIITDKNTWNKLQVSFISNHQYYTDFAKNNREVNKQNQIERLKNLLLVD